MNSLSRHNHPTEARILDVATLAGSDPIELPIPLHKTRDPHPDARRRFEPDVPREILDVGVGGSALVFGKEVMLQTHGKDMYGRTIADVLLADGTNVNHALVKDGWCWRYRKYAPGDGVLEGLEREARKAKRGLWADPHPVPPWIFRKSTRGSTIEAVESDSAKE